ncbi:hypothetical protein B9Z19DRAFT_1146172 [Tuber borchii]|uniref:Uncharacterized protein n=1 Tax=Tuber borchii TaxID=42251 RepID=A0A2T6ZPM7_TUBBO|nr:hypothetical protein B9Z19DRAFT_1146172 [Tuber borchii]
MITARLRRADRKKKMIIYHVIRLVSIICSFLPQLAESFDNYCIEAQSTKMQQAPSLKLNMFYIVLGFWGSDYLVALLRSYLPKRYRGLRAKMIINPQCRWK